MKVVIPLLLIISLLFIGVGFAENSIRISDYGSEYNWGYGYQGCDVFNLLVSSNYPASPFAYSYFKFPSTNMLGRIIDTPYFSYTTASAPANIYGTFYNFNNNSFNCSALFPSDGYVGDALFNDAMIAVNGQERKTPALLDSSIIRNIYYDNNFSIAYKTYGYTGYGTQGFIGVNDSGGYPLNFTLKYNITDYKTSSLISYDTVTWYDFFLQDYTFNIPRTNTAFYYNVSSNVMVTGVPWFRYVAPVYQNSPYNNLDSLISHCASDSIAYTNGTYITNIGTTYVGLEKQYDIFCFNLTTYFNNPFAPVKYPYYGIIKVTKSTALTPDFEFFSALGDNYANLFSYPIVTPPLPQSYQNVTISWTTSIPLTSQIAYNFVLPNGNLSGWNYLVDSDLTQSHSLTLNWLYVYPAIYYYTLSGFDNESNSYVARIPNGDVILYNFSVGNSGIFVPITGTPDNMSALDRSTRNNPMFPDQATGGIVAGIIILGCMTAVCFIAGGMPLGITALVSLIHVESIVGLLPLFLFIPIVFIDILLIVLIMRRTFFGEV